MSRSKFKLRRQFLVDPRLQWGLIARVLLLSWIVAAIVLGTLLGPLVLELESGNQPDDGAYSAATSLLYLHHRIWWVILSCTVFAVLVLLRLSHRIAGPMVRIRRAIDRLAEGQIVQPFRLRDGDHMQLEADSVNEMLHRLRARAAHTQLSLARVRNAQSALHDHESDAAARDRHLTELGEAVDQLEAQLLQTESEEAGS